MSTITLMNTIYTRIMELTGTLLNALLFYSIDYYKRLTLDGWFTNLKTDTNELMPTEPLTVAYKLMSTELTNNKLNSPANLTNNTTEIILTKHRSKCTSY